MQEALRIPLMSFVLLVAMAGIAITGPLEDAQIAAERRDYAAALRIIRPLAERGDPVAQRRLGSLYVNGYGVPKDYAEAVKWYRRAALQNDTEAQRRLGFMYETGRGIAEDPLEAAKWLRRAADQGDPDAQFELAGMYHRGRGVQKDTNVSASWYLRSAQQGFAIAQWTIGEMYEDGEGVPQDYVLAYMWTNLAASHPPSGAGPNVVTAIMIEARNRLAQKMTHEQIAEAQRLTREWKPKPER